VIEENSFTIAIRVEKINMAIANETSCFSGINGWRVAAVGDFGALHCQPALKFDRSTQLQFCTSPPIVANMTRPEKSLHILVNNPNTILHKKVNPK
jgi:hypothetical protein